jgi:hypothetical protein
MDMIERVARALTIYDGSDPDGRTSIADRPKRWMLMIEDARAAIAAMREPTEAMLSAAEEYRPPIHRLTWAGPWRAMIDAALNLPPQP